ncbi:tripartite tricarboxylate transporter substrate binding protein [Rhodovarius crocodyli]|uniref:Tripartite tricarboxylate transporter substrate binding protein n=1 Tax=Rhodovarius crocodyli TaxID=1979269 RepID=A0A437MCG5_9PROT|nr:tripartite tricarboxylate transporter substrate binding protein [Rhodovarius crocodyli]RVT95318.1 tripartite tricarboxylate transporter substrate binding protein [Rhodovarius crocodyli]
MIARRALLASAPALLAAPPVRAGIAATLLVGASAGSGVDQWARGLAPFLERHWAHAAVTVVNRPGQGGLAMARTLAGAAADGRTLGVVSTPSLLARAVEKGQERLLESLFFVASVADEPIVLVAPAGAQPSLAAISRMAPGALMAMPPAGSAPQLLGLRLAAQLGLSPFPFANSGAVRQAVLQGHVPVAILAAPEALPLVREGRIVALAVGGESRTDLLPDTPTLKEQGVALSSASCKGFAIPSGTPAELVSSISDGLSRMIADPEFLAFLESSALRPLFQGPDKWPTQVRGTLEQLALRWRQDPWAQTAG